MRHVFVFVWLALAGIPTAAVAGSPAEPIAPPPLREFRAAWIATVANKDWPSPDAAIDSAEPMPSVLGTWTTMVPIGVSRVALITLTNEPSLT